MVNEKNLELILGDLTRECGIAVSFFAAFKMDDITDKWSIAVAVATDGHDLVDKKKTIFTKLVELFAKYIDEDERASIARIGTFSVNDHLIKLLIEKYESGHVVKEDERVNGNIIHEGFVIRSNKISDVDAPNLFSVNSQKHV